MNTGGLEVAEAAGKIGGVHPEDRALQECSPSFGRASEPVGQGGSNIARAD
jgi:hypothetical protein